VEDWLMGILTSHGQYVLYFGTFGLLVICGLGVPIPEELTFLCAGFAASQVKDTNIAILCVMGVAGIMIGDSFPFLAGKYWGMSLLRKPKFARVITPERIEKVEDFFRRYGPWTVFGARFVAGLRMPAFFIAATMGVKYWTFFVLDLLGALISCPTSILLAYYFGPQAKEMVAQSHVYLFGLLGLGILYLVYHVVSHRKPSTATAPSPGPMTVELPSAPTAAKQDVPAPSASERS